MALSPLPLLLNDTRENDFAIKCGLRVKYKLTHLMYLNDIKLYTDTDDHLRSLLTTTDRPSYSDGNYL